jgi:hypothetical protein
MDMHVPAPGTLLTLERGDVRIKFRCTNARFLRNANEPTVRAEVIVTETDAPDVFAFGLRSIIILKRWGAYACANFYTLPWFCNVLVEDTMA